MIWDLAIIETNGGGDFTMAGNDLAVFKGIENAIYLAMFGGNVAADTKFPRPAGVQDFSYWGNALLYPSLKNAWFNSLTERTLNKTALNSTGRITIENAIKKDLGFLAPSGATLTVNVTIVSTDRISASLRVVLPTGASQVGSFAFVFNPITGDFDLTDFDFADFF